MLASLLALFLLSAPVAWAQKKGVAVEPWHASRIFALNSAWYHNWKLAPTSGVGKNCFVPMFWGKKGQVDSLGSALSAKTPVPNLLVYNEPDFPRQANRTVEEVVHEWNMLTPYTGRISSPNAARPTDPWMKHFMQEARQRGLKIDFFAIHWYGGPDAEKFLGMIDRVHESYGLPIWITEFAVADWRSTKYGTPNRYNEDDVIAFMNRVLPELDKRPYVEKYAWLAVMAKKESLRPSLLFNEAGELTRVGKAYAAHREPSPCLQ